MDNNQVELTDLPSSHWVEDWSLAVKGIGHCTILDFSFLTTDNEVGVCVGVFITLLPVLLTTK